MASDGKHTKPVPERDSLDVDESPPTYEQSTGMSTANAPRQRSILDTIQQRRQFAQRQGHEGMVIVKDFVSQSVVPYLADRLSECDEVELVLIPAEGTPWQDFSKQGTVEKVPESKAANGPTVSLLSAPSETISSCIFMTGVIGKQPFWGQPENVKLLRQEIMTAFLLSNDKDNVDQGQTGTGKESSPLPDRPLKPKRRLWGQRGSSPKLRSTETHIESLSTSSDGSSLVEVRKDEVSLRWTTDFGLYETHVSDAITVKLTLSGIVEDSNWA